jgi:glycerol-3-phosphate dehydrogenase
LALWLDRYGTRARNVAEFVSSAADEPLRALPTYTRREVLFIAKQEKVLHLDDIVLRRTMMALLGQLSFELLAELAAVLASTLDWSEEKSQQEIQRTLKILEAHHGVKL